MSLNSLSEASICCSICLSNSNDDLVSLPCDHFYHKTCISKNYIFEITRNNKTAYECPECRAEITMDEMAIILNIQSPKTQQTRREDPEPPRQIIQNPNHRIVQIENNPLLVHRQIQQNICCQTDKKTIIAIFVCIFGALVIFCIVILPKLTKH